MGITANPCQRYVAPSILVAACKIQCQRESQQLKMPQVLEIVFSAVLSYGETVVFEAAHVPELAGPTNLISGKRQHEPVPAPGLLKRRLVVSWTLNITSESLSQGVFRRYRSTSKRAQVCLFFNRCSRPTVIYSSLTPHTT